MNDDLGASASRPGSREPSPSVSAASGFDPSRGHTRGDWYATNHFADQSTPCNCAYVLSDGYAGSVCQISINNGRSIGDGGNDCPPAHEAAANGRLIALTPRMYEALVAIANHLTPSPWDLARRVLAPLCDSDGSPEGRDAQRLDGEAATARAEGSAQTTPPSENSDG
jgi:hypothetical protein